MERNEAIDELTLTLESLKEGGHEAVGIDAMLRHLKAMQQGSTMSMEFRRLQHQTDLAGYDAKVKTQLEMFKSVLDAGKDALNTALLVNGGAVVAMLSFLGSSAGKENAGALGLSLTGPLLAFGGGICAAGVAFGARYFTQHFYHVENEKAGNGFLMASVAFGLGAFLAFGFGVFRAYQGFTAHFSMFA